MSKEFSNVNPNMLSLAEIRAEAYQQGMADNQAKILQIIREGEPTDIGRRCTLERIYDFVNGAEE